MRTAPARLPPVDFMALCVVREACECKRCGFGEVKSWKSQRLPDGEHSKKPLVVTNPLSVHHGHTTLVKALSDALVIVTHSPFLAPRFTAQGYQDAPGQ